MPLPKSLTTVTSFSKALAMVLFILFPILAFFLGMTYQESVMNLKIQQLEEKLIQLSRYPTPTPDYSNTANWKTYINELYDFSFNYPDNWIITEYDRESYRGIVGLSPTNKKRTYTDTITLFLYENPKKLSLTEYSKEREKNNKSGDPANIVYPNDEIILMSDGTQVYYQKEHYCVTVCQRYTWQKDDKIYMLIKYPGEPSDKKSQLNYIFSQVLSTFKFLDNNPSPTCIPRPACLDATPRCLMPESENMCPPSPKPTGQTACTQEAKQCPDGSYVGRTGPNCEFSACPTP